MQRPVFGKQDSCLRPRQVSTRRGTRLGLLGDIGTIIEAFYDANLALTAQPVPPFSFYDEQAPIYTRSRHLPPTKLLEAHVSESRPR